jgi:hypothetical protein
MVPDPLQCRIREDEIVLFVGGGCPLGDITVNPPLAWIPAASVFEHFRGVIEAYDARIRPALREHGGAVSRAAAEIDDGVHAFHGNASDEISNRNRAVFFKKQIQLRIPCRHKLFPFRESSRFELMSASETYFGPRNSFA